MYVYIDICVYLSLPCIDALTKRVYVYVSICKVDIDIGIDIDHMLIS